VAAPDALAELRRLFEGTLSGAGAWNYTWPDSQLRRLRQAVGQIPFWTSDGLSDERDFLVFDDARLSEADEAWLPVRTPHGSGVLIWPNSD
jgi:hypothetical protein